MQLHQDVSLQKATEDSLPLNDFQPSNYLDLFYGIGVLYKLPKS